MKKTTIIIFFSLITFTSLSQSKRELKQQVKDLNEEKIELQQKLESVDKEKETLSTKLNRISDIEIDDVITPDEQPESVVIGESGWRVELNGLKYKNDLIGQLGTIWVLDSNGQTQPQGAFTLSDYSVEPELISQDKEVIFKKFISKGTSMEGDGGTSFISITAKLSKDQFSNFTINIEGTSQIKPKTKDLRSMSLEVRELFNIPVLKGIFVCTGMHVVKYHSVVYSKSEGEAKITSPVVNIGGDFYAESSEESSEYLVVRQLTALYEPSKVNEKKVDKKLESISKLEDSEKIKTKTKKFNPQEILGYLLQREPTFEEITAFESNPTEFIQNSSIQIDTNSVGEQQIINIAKEKIIVPPEHLENKNLIQ